MDKLTPGNYPSEFDIRGCQITEEPPYGLERKSEILVAGDLRRFTETMEYLKKYGDPTEMGAFLSRLFDAMAEIVEKQDGSINKYLGDGFLAHYRIKDSSNPSQILNRIIYDVYDIINITFPQLSGTYNHTKLGLSIVISMAPDVIWGRIGGLFYTDYSMLGPSINSLFRALEFAKGNSILVFEDLGQYLRKNWVLVDLGKQSLDGLLRPIELFSVLRPKEDDENNGKVRGCVQKCRSYHLCSDAYSRGREGKELINCQDCIGKSGPICWHWGECNVKENYGKAKGNHDGFTCCHMCIHFKSCFHSYFLGKFKRNMVWCGECKSYQLISPTS